MGRCSRLLPESPSGGETRLSPDAPTKKRSRSTWWTHRSFRCPSVAKNVTHRFIPENLLVRRVLLCRCFLILSSRCESSCWPSDPLQPTSPIVIGTGAQGHRGTKKYQEARTDLCVSFFANPCSYSILVHGSRKICKPRHCQPDRRKTGRKDLQVLVDSCESLFTATRVQSFFSNSVKSS